VPEGTGIVGNREVKKEEKGKKEKTSLTEGGPHSEKDHIESERTEAEFERLQSKGEGDLAKQHHHEAEKKKRNK